MISQKIKFDNTIYTTINIDTNKCLYFVSHNYYPICCRNSIELDRQEFWDTLYIHLIIITVFSTWFKLFQNPVLLTWHDFKALFQAGGWFPLVKYALFDIALLTSDVFLDFSTFFDFLAEGNEKWAYSNLSFMFIPFVLRIVTSSIDEFRKQETKVLKLINILYKSCQSLPLLQTVFAIKRFIKLKEQFVFTTNPKELLKTFQDSTRYKTYEGLGEAAPSQILNLTIFFLRGSITETQILSLCTSYLSLSLTSVSVFYLFRTKQEVEANPPLPLMLITLFPMLLNTAASMILWSILSAYANVFIIPCLLVIFLATYGSLKIASYFDKTEAESIYSLIEISLINTWQPIAIGKHKHTLAISAIVSYGTRMVFIICFWLTDIRNNLSSMVNHQWYPPLLTCITRESFGSVSIPEKYNSTCYNISSCFCGIACDKTKEQIR